MKTEVFEKNKDKVDAWIKQTILAINSTDRDICPICKDQIHFCCCDRNLAQEIMELAFSDEIAAGTVIKPSHGTPIDDRVSIMEKKVNAIIKAFNTFVDRYNGHRHTVDDDRVDRIDE